MNDISLKRQAIEYIKILKPIAEALDKLQREDPLISDSVEHCIVLRNTFVEQGLLGYPLIKFKYNQRYEMPIKVTDAHYLVYLMDPRYMGKRLTTDETNRGLKMINEDCPDFLAIYMKFKNKNAHFTKNYFADSTLKDILPNDWWKYFESYLPISSKSAFPPRRLP